MMSVPERRSRRQACVDVVCQNTVDRWIERQLRTSRACDKHEIEPTFAAFDLLRPVTLADHAIDPRAPR